MKEDLFIFSYGQKPNQSFKFHLRYRIAGVLWLVQKLWENKTPKIS